MGSSIWRSTAMIWGLLISGCAVAMAADSEGPINEPRVIWKEEQAVVATDLARFRDQWICAVQTRAGIRIIASDDGQTWRSLSVVKSENPNFPLRNPRLAVPRPKQLLLSAVAPKAPLGGYSRTWTSKDGEDWSEPRLAADSNYLVSSVATHNGAAFNFQCGSICGSMSTIRIGATQKGRRFRDQFEETFPGILSGSGALTFSTNRGYCVMSEYVGVAKAPYDSWQWKKLPTRLHSPNSMQTSDNTLLVVAGVSSLNKNVRTKLFKLAPPTEPMPKVRLVGPAPGKRPPVPDAPELVRLADFPPDVSGFTGLAEHDGHVFISYHQGSTVQLAKLAYK